jgi:hypothetical protein
VLHLRSNYWRGIDRGDYHEVWVVSTNAKTRTVRSINEACINMEGYSGFSMELMLPPSAARASYLYTTVSPGLQHARHFYSHSINIANVSLCRRAAHPITDTANHVKVGTPLPLASACLAETMICCRHQTLGGWVVETASFFPAATPRFLRLIDLGPRVC